MYGVHCDLCVLWQNLRVVKYVGDEKKLAWGKHWIELGFNSELVRAKCAIYSTYQLPLFQV